LRYINILLRLYVFRKLNKSKMYHENLNSKPSWNQLDTFNSNILYIYMKQKIFVNYNINIIIKFYS